MFFFRRRRIERRNLRLDLSSTRLRHDWADASRILSRDESTRSYRRARVFGLCDTVAAACRPRRRRPPSAAAGETNNVLANKSGLSLARNRVLIRYPLHSCYMQLGYLLARCTLLFVCYQVSLRFRLFPLKGTVSSEFLGFDIGFCTGKRFFFSPPQQ